MTLEEKVSLLAGKNWWETVPIERLNIPSAKVSDGPNGARGAQLQGGVKAACFPAASCLAASWDRAMVERIGVALAEETKTKGAICLLGPTVCPHRSPLGGRNFESFSEDPLLAGKLASSYIHGLQGQGIAATIKHFAANEQETRRFTMNVNVSERALREIYLKPFEIAIKESSPRAVMTSYNLVNGTHSDMNKHLLQTILKGDWGYKGLIMSDWGGCNSIVESLNAGLDLEMPGPTRFRKLEDVKKALDDGKLDSKTIDDRALSILKFVKESGKFEHPETPEEEAIINPEHQKLIREAGAQGMVLLKNENNILPLKAKGLKSVAALGLAKEALVHGGGSASVHCHYKITPYEALQRVLGDEVEIRYAEGAKTFRSFPELATDIYDLNGNHGLTLSRYSVRNFDTKPTSISNHPMSAYGSFDNPCQAFKLEGTFKPSVSGSHYLSFSSLGPTTITIDDKIIYHTTENNSDPMGFLLGAIVETKLQFNFVVGQEYKLSIKSLAPEVAPNPSEPILAIIDNMPSARMGFVPELVYEEDILPGAVEAAKGADVVLVFVGNTSAWETEGKPTIPPVSLSSILCAHQLITYAIIGQDMLSMSLPAYGSQDRLISAVAAVNPNVVVINSTGVAIDMPWLSQVSAVLQAWFPGQEAGNSIADVLFGAVNPSGRLPMTIPKSLADTPCYENFPGDVEKLQVNYEEGIYIGYRFYDKHPEKALFPFGFGLSYTNFSISELKLDKDVLKAGDNINASVLVKNTGSVTGSEVVQVYVAPPSSSTIDRPIKTLVGFAKAADLEPGSTNNVKINFDIKSLVYWDEEKNEWRVEPGEYEVLVGTSSTNIAQRAKIIVEEAVFKA
jgi:beta-glucosidase